MAQTNFRFESEVLGGDQFSVVSFTGHEAISTLYRYEIELKAPVAAAIDLDDMLDSSARFISSIESLDYPIHGVLSSLDEIQTAQGYVYYSAILTPRLWSFSTYKTNEIYTFEQTVETIIRAMLESADFVEDVDFDFNGLNKGNLLQRDYICQFGESDFDFISRLMENEGIFYYFDQSAGPVEKIVFINDMNYEQISKPGLIYDVATQTNRLQDCIHGWICRRQRLAAGVTVRDFNPDDPSLDISSTMPIDSMGRGTEYIYGCQVNNPEEATYLTEIRAEEKICTKTRYYAESSVSRLRTGYLFGLSLHPNDKYNNSEYLVTEITHEGLNLDASLSASADATTSKPQYHNSFTAISASDQYRPPRITAKPRFYGTMTAFIHAEAASGSSAEVDEQGRYRVHLPFDRADGSKDSDDPDRKASTWIRMAQPYVGENEGTYFPLKGGTEVLLTFINGDPDQPIISGALPNAATPSLLNHDNAHVATMKTSGGVVNVSGAGSYTNRSIPVADVANQASASTTEAELRATFRGKGAEESVAGNFGGHFTPPSHFLPTPLESIHAQFKFYGLNDYGMAINPPLEKHLLTKPQETAGGDAHIDRSTGPMYVHRVGSTFAYPQQERVYFCGTFHEDFHMDDLGVIGKKRGRDSNWLMNTEVEDKCDGDPQGKEKEVFHFPAPGGNGTQPVNTLNVTAEELGRFAPNRIRGVSEDKRWGDQMTFAYGRQFNWSAGPEMESGGAFGTYNYGNGYTENLMTEMGGTSADIIIKYPIREEGDWKYTPDTTPSVPDMETGLMFDIVNTLGVADWFGDAASNTKDWVGDAASNTKDWVGDTVSDPIGWAKDAYDADINKDLISGRDDPGENNSKPPELKDTLQLDPNHTAVEKTFGHTYSYQMGLAVDIHEGNSISKTWGSSYSEVHGNQVEKVEGNSYSNIDGDQTDNIFGDSECWHYGWDKEVFVGTKGEYALSATSSFALSETISLTVGAVQDIYLASNASINLGHTADLALSLKTDVHFAFEAAFQLAGLLKVTVGSGIDISSTRIKSEMVDLQNGGTWISTKLFTLMG